MGWGCRGGWVMGCGCRRGWAKVQGLEHRVVGRVHHAEGSGHEVKGCGACWGVGRRRVRIGGVAGVAVLRRGLQAARWVSPRRVECGRAASQASAPPAAPAQAAASVRRRGRTRPGGHAGRWVATGGHTTGPAAHRWRRRFAVSCAARCRRRRPWSSGSVCAVCRGPMRRGRVGAPVGGREPAGGVPVPGVVCRRLVWWGRCRRGVVRLRRRLVCLRAVCLRAVCRASPPAGSGGVVGSVVGAAPAVWFDGVRGVGVTGVAGIAAGEGISGLRRRGPAVVSMLGSVLVASSARDRQCCLHELPGACAVPGYRVGGWAAGGARQFRGAGSGDGDRGNESGCAPG